MPNYCRAWVKGGTYFFTVNLLDRRQSLLVDELGALRAAFREARAARPFDMLAAVILPDHLHCLWTLPADDGDNGARWRHVKSAFSRSLPPVEPRDPVRKARAERGIWQRRYWEHVIRDERDLAAHVDYIHFNPVKHGYVDRARDWPWSSFHRWVHRGD